MQFDSPSGFLQTADIAKSGVVLRSPPQIALSSDSAGSYQAPQERRSTPRRSHPGAALSFIGCQVGNAAGGCTGNIGGTGPAANDRRVVPHFECFGSQSNGLTPGYTGRAGRGLSDVSYQGWAN